MNNNKVLLIDNYDSFTYNIANYIEKCRNKNMVIVKQSDKICLRDISMMKPKCIIFGPGPGYPKDAGITLSAIKTMHKDIPMLGICLGHQAIASNFGCIIRKSPTKFHGEASIITHDGKGIFADVKNPTVVGRYHSLVCEDCDGTDLDITATSNEDNEIMSIRHKYYNVHGVQFHPESILTAEGDIMMQNFLDSCI